MGGGLRVGWMNEVGEGNVADGMGGVAEEQFWI